MQDAFIAFGHQCFPLCFWHSCCRSSANHFQIQANREAAGFVRFSLRRACLRPTFAFGGVVVFTRLLRAGPSRGHLVNLYLSTKWKIMGLLYLKAIRWKRALKLDSESKSCSHLFQQGLSYLWKTTSFWGPAPSSEQVLHNIPLKMLQMLQIV